MATLQKWIDRAMRWEVDSTQYLPATAIEDANIVIHQIEDYITSAIWEGFFWDILTVTTTAIWQSEYRIPVISTGLFNWTPKVESISVKYTASWDFTKARCVDRETLDYDLAYYETSQSPWVPFFFVADDSVFIYPAPLEAVTWWIKFYGIKSLADVVATTTEADLFGGKIPFKYYYLISDWMMQYIYKNRGKEVEATNARREFEQELLPKLVERLWNRKVWISVRWTPNLNIYK